MCQVLEEFAQVMKSYQVEDYRAYATSAMREAKNSQIILEQIRVRTGIQVQVISPDNAISLVFCSAKVRPAKVPVSSTSASFKPNTIEPTYCRRSSSKIASSFCSCRSSSSAIFCACGISAAISS